MISDEYIIIRPPSEANSFLLPITFGCSHNKCTFCPFYRGIRFRARSLDDIKRDIDEVAKNYSWSVRRVFLENGDALVCSYSRLKDILGYLNERFPYLERVASYATPQNALHKTTEELASLKQLGLKLVYFGVESGDEEILLKVQKGVNYAQIVEAAQKMKRANITLSATIILGLGGVKGSKRHALETARILSEIDPDYVGALTLMIAPETELYDEWKEGKFSAISPLETLEELKIIIANSKFTNCFFTANHASNYLPLKINLPEQGEEAIKLLNKLLADKDASTLKPEFLRAL